MRDERTTRRAAFVGAAAAAFGASVVTFGAAVDGDGSRFGVREAWAQGGPVAPSAPPNASAPTAPSAAPAPSQVSDAGAGSSVSGCVESVPKGAQRPGVSDAFPARGTSGWAATLAITIHHGKGERVLPSGLDLSSAIDAKKYLKQAGFAIPDQDGGAGAHLWSEPDDPNKLVATTHLELPLVALPEGPGRNVLQLPPLPVAVARANGEIATVCTHPHTIVVEDPTANVPDAEPKGNPPPRPQREEWTALKKGLLWGGLGLLAGAALAYFGYRWMHREKPLPPPKPPRPPWEVALEKLDEVRHAGLLEAGRHTEYYDRVSDAVRGYLGARFGFDGLESTTDEILAALKRQGTGFVRLDESDGGFPGNAASGIPLREVARFLADCDLVKFANLTPSPDQCSSALVTGEHIVRSTSSLGGPSGPIAAPIAEQVVEPKAAPATPGPVDADAAWKPPAREVHSDSSDATHAPSPATDDRDGSTSDARDDESARDRSADDHDDGNADGKGGST